MSPFRSKIIDPANLLDFVCARRKEGKTIATLNGSFDLLHTGHLHILSEGAKQADLLLVLLNSDESIKSYKDPNRPIRPLNDRLEQIAAIEMVSAVSWFDQTDPCALLQAIDPDVHVNGAEYGPNCIEAKFVRKLHLVDAIPGFSSTNLIQKIKAL